MLSLARALALSLAGLALACGGRSEPDPPAPDPPADPAPEPPDPEPPAAVEPPEPPPPLPASRREPRGPYTAEIGQHCDGYPYLFLRTPPGICVGLVMHGEQAPFSEARRFKPRSLVQDPRRDGVFWLTDRGPHVANRGRLWRLERGEGGAWSAALAMGRLNRPHGIRVGPDGWIYVGELQRIIRIDPQAEDPESTRQVVVDAMPTDLRFRDRIRFHPMTAFVFAPDWDLIVNQGSGTDHCAESLEQRRCEDEREHLAALWRYGYLGPHRWAARPTYIAHGLRNSVALAAHPSGTILQGENGVDFPEVDRPHEELNVIEAGRHYGWPYCFDRDRPDPRWAHSGFSCDPSANPGYTPPHLLLPPHGAPLGMAYYTADRMPRLRGRLLISLHGYRAPGHRLLSFPTDARGVPPADAEAEEVIAGWDPSDTGPRGAPVELALARDGSVWIAEDKNGTILRLSADVWSSARGAAPGEEPGGPEGPADPAFIRAHAEVLRPRCAHCHAFLRGEPAAALGALRREGWLRAEGGQTRLWTRVRPGAPRRMPLDRPLERAELDQIRRWLQSLDE